MTKALKITPAGETSVVDVSELEDYQREVCGDIEAVSLGLSHTMILDEEGKLKGSAPNVIATLLRSRIVPSDVIAGTVLIVRSANDAGDWGDIDEAAEQQIRSLSALV